MNPFTALTEEEIKRRLACSTSRHEEEKQRYRKFFKDPPRPAAVLLPLFRSPDGSWNTLYTRRTNMVAEHKGQVSFPGGRKNPEDANLQETALREAYEEIGLHPKDVRILGEMEHIHTVTNFLVCPVVGVIPPNYPFRLQTEEVERVFSIPLVWLVDPNHYHLRTKLITFPASPEPQTLEVIYYDAYDGETLWGVSAEITLRLLECLGLVKRM